MTQNNDYKTPRDRIGRDFREKLFEMDEDNCCARFSESDKCRQVSACEYGAVDLCGNNRRTSFSRSKRNVFFSEGSELPLAMIYSPDDSFDNLYEQDEALEKGTLFADLFFPFEAYGCGAKRPLQNGGMKK